MVSLRAALWRSNLLATGDCHVGKNTLLAMTEGQCHCEPSAKQSLRAMRLPRREERPPRNDMVVTGDCFSKTRNDMARNDMR
jgi:hypothetical protein